MHPDDPEPTQPAPAQASGGRTPPGAIPGRIGRYRPLAELGTGGMGSVYLAHDPVMDRHVALKVIAAKYLDQPNAIQRFRREIQVISRLHHPQIVAAFDADSAGDVHFLVMEYVPGTNLARLLARVGRLPVGEAVDYVRQAALGLQHAHEAHLVHRDIKPSNLLLGPGGVVKIADLGLARVADDSTTGQDTLSGSTLGTPDYMAPEQADDARSADIRADIYSLGCTLYHLLTGNVPFPIPGYLPKMRAHQDSEPLPLADLRPEVSPELAAVVRKMMEKDPARRQQAPAEVARELLPFAHPAEDGRDDGFQLASTQGSGEGGPGGIVPGTTVAIPDAPVRVPEATTRPESRPGVSAEDDSIAPSKGGTAAGWGRRQIGPFSASRAAIVLLVAALAIVLWYFPDRSSISISFFGGGGSARTADAALPPLATNSIGMELVAIAPGSDWMGSPESEPGRHDDEGPRHRVTIGRAFYLGKFEVTQAEFARVMGRNPSHFAPSGQGAGLVQGFDTGRLPVDSVSWSDAQEFCRTLSELPSEREAGRTYRLPTEAEWEYSCRAETLTPFSVGEHLLPNQANFNGLEPYGGVPKAPPSMLPAKVGSFAPNAFGLHDMHGNVGEWCLDTFRVGTREDCGAPCGYYPDGPRVDPRVEAVGGPRRVSRGGGFSFSAAECRSSARMYWAPDQRDYFLGFRVACVPKP